MIILDGKTLTVERLVLISRSYEKVSLDISKGERDEGVWTLAFAKSEGNNQKAEALYIELMVQRYKDQIFV